MASKAKKTAKKATKASPKKSVKTHICRSCDTELSKKDLGKKTHVCEVCGQASVELKID